MKGTEGQLCHPCVSAHIPYRSIRLCYKADAFWEATRAEREKADTERQRERVAKAKAPAYTTLGLQFGAPLPEIKKAYRKKARKAHPDTGGSHEQMTLLNIAYQTLTQK